MPCQRMLILRGNRGQYADDQGRPFNYTRGSVARMGREGVREAQEL